MMPQRERQPLGSQREVLVAFQREPSTASPREILSAFQREPTSHRSVATRPAYVMAPGVMVLLMRGTTRITRVNGSQVSPASLLSLNMLSRWLLLGASSHHLLPTLGCLLAGVLAMLKFAMTISTNWLCFKAIGTSSAGVFAMVPAPSLVRTCLRICQMIPAATQ